MKKAVVGIAVLAVLLVLGIVFVSAALADSGESVEEEKPGFSECSSETCGLNCGGSCGVPTCGCGG